MTHPLCITSLRVERESPAIELSVVLERRFRLEGVVVHAGESGWRVSLPGEDEGRMAFRPLGAGATGLLKRGILDAFQKRPAGRAPARTRHHSSPDHEREPMNPEIKVTDVQVWPSRNNPEGRTRALVAMTLNGVLKLTGLRLVEGKNGLFLSYPSEKKQGTDQYFPFIHPLDRTLGDAMLEQVLSAYQAATVQA